MLKSKLFLVRVLQKKPRKDSTIREINPEGRTGERCSASQYVNKLLTFALHLVLLRVGRVPGPEDQKKFILTAPLRQKKWTRWRRAAPPLAPSCAGVLTGNGSARG